MKPSFLVLLILMNLLWAVSYPAFKAVAPYLDSGNIVTLRFGLAAVMLGVVWPWLPGKAPRGGDLVRAAVMGVIVFSIAPRLQVEGVHQGKAGDASILVAFDPLITSIAAALFLRETVSARRWVGFGFGVAGVLLLAEVWRPGFRALHGLNANLLVLSSFVCETAYSVMGKPILSRASPTKLLGVALCSASVVNVLVDGADTFVAAKALPAVHWGTMLYLAIVCTLAGYILWYIVIRETDVSLIALTVFIQPIAGLSVSIIALGEAPHWGQLWGSVAIMIGILIGLRRKAPPKNPLPPPN